jgi:hypothetical protein
VCEKNKTFGKAIFSYVYYNQRKGSNMKRLVTIFLAMAILLVASAMGQSVALRRTPKSMNQKTGTKTWEYNTGLRVVGIGSKVYLTADTAGSGASGVTTFTWAFEGVPAGSVAAYDSGTGHPVDNSFTPDSSGFYYLLVTVDGGKASRDTIFASTYTGIDRDNMFKFGYTGCACHKYMNGRLRTNFDDWQNSNHATIFKRGVTGNLEMDALINKGVYAKSCPQCHTAGAELNAKNGNWLNQARFNYAGWDTTWYQGLPTSGGDILITTNDLTAWNSMPAPLQSLASIGCENCHGPAYDHVTSGGDQTKIAVSLDAGVCNVCHDGSGHHNIGTMFNASVHAAMPNPELTSGCSPCHTGSTFPKWVDAGKPWPFPGSLFSAATDGKTPNNHVTCAVCHDPHSMELRTVSVDSLMNGYRPPVGAGGNGGLCMNCHRSRVSSAATIKPNSAPYYGFKARFYPHHSNQADMFFGQNAWQFGDNTISGVNTHMNLPDGCATCHMAARNGHPNHTWSMDESNPSYAKDNFKPITACVGCHGNIADYNDIKAGYDYDKNGRIDGVETEVAGLMATLKSRLPQDAEGNVIGEGSVTSADSAAINGRLDLVAGIWTYWWVYMDGSNGMHNAKYTVSILQKALGYYPTAVERTDLNAPSSYALTQNYPNPFNPTTNIRFSLPQSGRARVDVYDVLGQHVTTLLDETMGAGNFQVTWNGQDKNGAKVASGMYIYRLQAGNNFSAVKKMLLVK